MMNVENLNALKNSSEQRDNEEGNMLPGFRFHPTDEELVGFYLRRQVEKKAISTNPIRQIDVYKYEPWDLPKERSNGRDGDRESYFFCRRGRKYKNSIRPNRVTATGNGFWKATGIDKPIYSNNSSCSGSLTGLSGTNGFIIGLKKSLVYYRGSAGKGTKTDWMMHEFRLPSSSSKDTDKDQEAEVWTLCRIMKREVSYRTYPSDCRKLTSQKSFSNSSSVTSCFPGSINTTHNQQNFEDLAYDHDHFQVSNQAFPAQMKLTTQQVPSTGSCLSFWNQNKDDPLRDVSWDELRPVVQFALDQPIISSFR